MLYFRSGSRFRPNFSFADRAERIPVCHSGGDAVTLESKIKNIDNLSNAIQLQNSGAENFSNSALPVVDYRDSRIERTVVTMEKEIRLIDELVTKNIDVLAVKSIDDNNAIIDKTALEIGKLNNAEKPKKVPSSKKSNCIPGMWNWT